MSGKTYRAAVIGLGRMGSTFDDEIKQGGQFFMPYCHAPTYVASPHTELVAGADPHAEQGAIFAHPGASKAGRSMPTTVRCWRPKNPTSSAFVRPRVTAPQL